MSKTALKAAMELASLTAEGRASPSVDPAMEIEQRPYLSRRYCLILTKNQLVWTNLLFSFDEIIGQTIKIVFVSS